MFIFQMLDS